MKVPLFHPPEGLATCDLVDGPRPTEQCGVIELSAAGAKISFSTALPALTYIDCRLRLESGVLPQFACVLGWRKNVLRLRWLHVDRSDLDLLRDRLSQTMKDDWSAGETNLIEPRERKVSPEKRDPTPVLTAPVDPAVEALLSEILPPGETDTALLDNLKQVLGRILQANRAEAAGDPYDSRHVELLERKVTRLASSLNDAESLIGRLQTEVASGPRTAGSPMTSGLSAEDGAREAKEALLKALFQENVAIRDHLKPRG